MKVGVRALCVSVKVSVDQNQRSCQRPNVEGDADPAGGDLHPHRRPLTGHGLIIGVGAAERMMEEHVS